MSVKLALWSLTLVPGEKYPIYVKQDFQISNAALAEELASATGRSVVKVTHFPVHPDAFGSNSDSEIDSEDFGDSDLDAEDEFELDEQEGFKEVPPKAKANGVKADESMEQDGEQGEEDEEDSEEDEDFSDDEEAEEVTNVICALTAGRIEQSTLDLTFTEGQVIQFEITGENAVHLMGNYIEQPNPYDSESDDEHDHDDYDEMFDGESDEEDEDVSAFIEELKEPKTKKALTAGVAESKPKKAAAPAPTPAAAAPAAAPSDKKRKAEAIDSPASKTAATPAAGAEGLSKAQKKKLNKKAKTEETPAAAAAKPEVASAKAAGVKRTLPSGLIIEDIKKGDGPAAKGGKRLSMRYIGKLTDGKQFDANTAGKPFSFVLGRGEVIKGWDEGLLGMNVGGERRLTIPAQLAYGSQKIPGIPKNSTLKFEVKLLAVN